MIRAAFRTITVSTARCAGERDIDNVGDAREEAAESEGTLSRAEGEAGADDADAADEGADAEMDRRVRSSADSVASLTGSESARDAAHIAGCSTCPGGAMSVPTHKPEVNYDTSEEVRSRIRARLGDVLDGESRIMPVQPVKAVLERHPEISCSNCVQP